MRGDLVSRPVAEVMLEAENLLKAGVKELLVISQDTSAYGVDVKFRTGFWNGRPLKTRMTELVGALGELASQYGAWVRLHYVYPYPSVDEVMPLMAEGKVLPYLDVPLQHAHPDVLKRMKRPANAEKTMDRIRAWREVCPELTIRSTFIASAALPIRRSKARPPTTCRARCPTRYARSAARASWKWPSASPPAACSARWASRCACWWTR
jgi:ribosomal protein S12 methylthiotransferase